jgi:hypothetical protein
MCTYCCLDVFILSGVADGHVASQTNLIVGYKSHEKVVSYFERKLGWCFRNVGSYVRGYSTFHVPENWNLHTGVIWCSLGLLSWLRGGGQNRGIEVGRCVEPRVILAVHSNRQTYVSDAFVSGSVLLGVSAKIRHVCLVSVWRLVVRAERLGSHWTDFNNIYLNIYFFRKFILENSRFVKIWQ